MNVAGLMKPTWEDRSRARVEFARYTRSIREGKRLTELDRRAMDVLKKVELGRTLLNVQLAMRSSGQDAQGRPKLAIANAAAKWCFFSRDEGVRRDEDGQWSHPISRFYSCFDNNPGWLSERTKRLTGRNNRFTFLRNMFPIALPKNSRPPRARVPTVPLHLRPRGDLGSYAILWEAEWESMPIDPFLLRRVTADWFVVVAHWDLTPLERMVMEEAVYRGE